MSEFLKHIGPVSVTRSRPRALCLAAPWRYRGKPVLHSLQPFGIPYTALAAAHRFSQKVGLAEVGSDSSGESTDYLSSALGECESDDMGSCHDSGPSCRPRSVLRKPAPGDPALNYKTPARITKRERRLAAAE